MTTAVYSTTWQHTSDATFRAWGSAFSAKLQSVGLQQTADTGQINWTTVTRPATANAVAGYEIYQFTDSLQATSPIFIKIEYGTGNGTDTTYGYPGMWITVGQGSNGAGTLTGTLSARTQVSGYYSAARINSTNTAYPTYICYNGSYLGVVLKLNGLTTTNSNGLQPGAAFMIGRGTDSTGAYVAHETTFITANQPANDRPQAIIQCINDSTGQLYTNTNGTFTCAWLSPAATSVNGNNFQLYPCWAVFNQAQPINWLLFGLTGEIATGATVVATPFGSTQHTYLMTGPATTGWGVPGGTYTYAMLMLWE